ncbi:MAG: DUF4238 domain-containing protein [Saprospiraceae bacterium]
MGKYKNQHIIPQVYLKHFGFPRQFKTEIWFVSVKNLENGKWEDREIENFLSDTHIYTLETYKEVHEFIIENDLNGGIENRINVVIDQLNSGKLTANIQLALAETTANFLARTYRHRKWLEGWLNRENFRDFFEILVEFEGYSEEEKNNIFDSYTAMSCKEAINSLMVSYMNHTSKQLISASIEVLITSKDKPYFTSDNPVSIMNEVGYGEIGRDEMEIYFPLSDTILLHFYWHEIEKPIERIIKNISDQDYEYFHREVILKSADKFIISPIDKSLLGK